MGLLSYDPRDIPPPKFGKTALELLNDPVADPPSLSSAYGFQFASGVIGGFVQLVTNWTYRRPLIAGVHRYPIYFAVGATVGHLFMNWRKSFWAERDAVYRHYVELHPEDFPPPERKQYKDVLLEWVPNR